MAGHSDGSFTLVFKQLQTELNSIFFLNNFWSLVPQNAQRQGSAKGARATLTHANKLSRPALPLVSFYH
jgi:hypothetical protein